jgi:hypothetical protein
MLGIPTAPSCATLRHGVRPGGWHAEAADGNAVAAAAGMRTPAAMTLVLDAPDATSMDNMLTRLQAVSQPAPDAAAVDATTPPRSELVPGTDRRRARRRPADEFAQELRISLPGAAEARAIDVSSTGVLTETTHRLCPGRTVDLFLRLNGTRRVVRARVVRSAVHAVSPKPIFRAALQFEDACRLPESED